MGQPQFESPDTLSASINALSGAASHTPRTPRGFGGSRSLSSPGGGGGSRSLSSPRGGGGSQPNKTPQPRRSKSAGHGQARTFQFSLAPRGTQNARTPRSTSATRSDVLATPVKTTPRQVDFSQAPVSGDVRGVPPPKGAFGQWPTRAAVTYPMDTDKQMRTGWANQAVAEPIAPPYIR